MTNPQIKRKLRTLYSGTVIENRYINVIVQSYPISDRYCKKGDLAMIDLTNKQIRCNGVWFDFNSNWTVTNP